MELIRAATATNHGIAYQATGADSSELGLDRGIPFRRSSSLPCFATCVLTALLAAPEYQVDFRVHE